MKNVVGSITRGQGNEILNQIEKAMKAAGVNPEEKASEIIRTNFFSKAISDFLANGKEIKSAILSLISSGETLKLRALDGSKTIRASKNVFYSIDSDFKSYGADEKGGATEEMEVSVYEMAQNANFAQMFGELHKDPETLCLSQHQILEFIDQHKSWLRKDGYATFFLFKSSNQFFVAGVGVEPDPLVLECPRRAKNQTATSRPNATSAI